MSQKHKYRIAVIIPVYNRESYVLETLQSIDKLNRLPDEIVVVDDGSSDRSVEVVKSWKPTRAPQAKLIEQRNQGATVAMNVAIENTQADLIAPLDSDDVFLPHHLDLLESAFQRYPDMSVCSGNSGRLDNLPHFKRDGFEEDVFQNMEFKEESDGLRMILGSAYLGMLGGAFIPTCSTLFSKEKFEKAGRYDPTMRTCYDTDFWLRMSKQGRFGFYMEKISLVRKHDGNLTHRRHIVSQIMSYISTYEKLIRMADELGLTDDELVSTRKMLAKRLSGAVNRASRYGVRPYLAVGKELARRGCWRDLIRAKPFIRAMVYPQGNSSKLHAMTETPVTS